MSINKREFFIFSVFVTLFFMNIPAIQATETELWRNGISLIPYPQIVKMGGEDFVFEKKIDILIDKGALPDDILAAEELKDRLKNQWNTECRVTELSSGVCIVLTRQGAPEEVGDQGYLLETTASRLIIRANNSTGLFYGVQTLLQIIKEGRTGL